MRSRSLMGCGKRFARSHDLAFGARLEPSLWLAAHRKLLGEQAAATKNFQLGSLVISTLSSLPARQEPPELPVGCIEAPFNFPPGKCGSFGVFRRLNVAAIQDFRWLRHHLNDSIYSVCILPLLQIVGRQGPTASLRNVSGLP